MWTEYLWKKTYTTWTFILPVPTCTPVFLKHVVCSTNCFLRGCEKTYFVSYIFIIWRKLSHYCIPGCWDQSGHKTSCSQLQWVQCEQLNSIWFHSKQMCILSCEQIRPTDCFPAVGWDDLARNRLQMGHSVYTALHELAIWLPGYNAHQSKYPPLLGELWGITKHSMWNVPKPHPMGQNNQSNLHPK